ncbi:MAG: hypothetical protein HY238_20940 [Acidobacteria bacterium]|nr:hypothetical protein [Acidobacteriota bacterium]
MYNVRKAWINVGLPEIGVGRARREFSKLLRQIEADPDAGYRILVHNKVVAELRSLTGRPGRIIHPGVGSRMPHASRPEGK